MAFEIIQGFDNASNAPLDVRFIATSESDMLGIKWVYDGLVVARIDQSPIKLFICTASAATQPGTPDWTELADWEEFTGTAGADGTDGSQIYSNSGAPSDVLGQDGDFYLDNTSGDYYLKSGGTWGVASGNLTGPAGSTGNTGPAGADGDIYASTSTDSRTIGTGSLSLTIETGRAYTVAQSVIVATDASNYMEGTVTSYDSGTGALVVNVTTITGSGTYASWSINMDGSPGPAGADGADGTDGTAGVALTHNEADITLDESKVTSVEAGGWTPQAPWSASVQNDTRANKNTPSGIIGDMTRHSVSYNGTSWFDNGVWTGLDGNNGTNGDTPYIQNGNWWISGADTGVAATGPAGATGEGVVHYSVSPTNSAYLTSLGLDLTVPCTVSVQMREGQILYMPDLNQTSNLKIRAVRVSRQTPRDGNEGHCFVNGRFNSNGLQTYGNQRTNASTTYIRVDSGDVAVFYPEILSGTTYTNYWTVVTSGIGLVLENLGRDYGTQSIRIGENNKIKGALRFRLKDGIVHYGGWFKMHNQDGTTATATDLFTLGPESPYAYLPDPMSGIIMGDSDGQINNPIWARMPLSVNGVQVIIFGFGLGYFPGLSTSPASDCSVAFLWQSTQTNDERVKIQVMIKNQSANRNNYYTFGGSYIASSPETMANIYGL